VSAWNAHDLDRIMSHYADDIVFTANTVVRRWARPDGALRGKAELREHFRIGLELAPQLTFILEDVFTSPGGFAVLYRRDNGNRVIDVVDADDDGKARAVRALYAGPQA
jgi:hypothetical protein